MGIVSVSAWPHSGQVIVDWVMIIRALDIRLADSQSDQTKATGYACMGLQMPVLLPSLPSQRECEKYAAGINAKKDAAGCDAGDHKPTA